METGIKSKSQLSKAVSRKQKEALKAVCEWMEDESGYDDKVWSLVQRSIEENRLSERERFDDK